MKPILLIIGGSSTALEIRECAELYYSESYELIVNVVGNDEECSLSNVVKDGQLDDFIEGKTFEYIVGFTNQKLKNIFSEKLARGKKATIIHPMAYVSPSATIGGGTYIGATAVVSSNATVGEGCIINIGVSIGHDAVIGENCIFNPGTRVSGHCKIGTRTLFGANSFIFQGKSIGEDCAIDAMTYIDRDIEDRKLCTNNIGGLKIYKNRMF